VPASVVVPGGATVANFSVATTAVRKNSNAMISAAYAGVTRSVQLSVVRR